MGDSSRNPITYRALNRALLARQMLLAREQTSAIGAIERLMGMQAQQIRPPFVGLWTRLQDFDRESLVELLRQRKAVRATLMRGTLHIVSSKDYLNFRTAIQPALTAGMRAILKTRDALFDQSAVVDAASRCFAQRSQTFVEVRTALAAQFPGVDERSMGYLARTCIPLIMEPDDSEFAFAASRFFSAESWLGRPISAKECTADLVLRYLAAFGPATIADAQAWSSIPNLAPVFAALRPRLVTFPRPRKSELFDLPRAPRPHEDVPAPIRFVPAFDNLILSHADRTRIIADEHRARVSTKNLQILATFLIDGFVAGTWEIQETKKKASLTMSPFAAVPRNVKSELVHEAEKLVRFACKGASSFDVVLTSPQS